MKRIMKGRSGARERRTLKDYEEGKERNDSERIGQVGMRTTGV